MANGTETCILLIQTIWSRFCGKVTSNLVYWPQETVWLQENSKHALLEHAVAHSALIMKAPRMNLKQMIHLRIQRAYSLCKVRLAGTDVPQGLMRQYPVSPSEIWSTYASKRVESNTNSQVTAPSQA